MNAAIAVHSVVTPFGTVRCIMPARRQAQRQVALLIHGSGGCADVWEPMFGLFRQVDFIAIDLPGHGGSGGALLASVEQCAEFIEALRERLELPKLLVVGQSLGGAIAQRYAFEHPERCAGIVVANSAPDFKISDERFAAIETRWDETVRAYASGQVSSRAGAALREAALRMVAQRDPVAFAGDLRLCNGFSSRSWAAQLRVPVLIIAGHEDALTAASRSIELRDLIEHAEMVIFSPCGHCTMLEQPLRFAAEIDLFAAQIAARTGAV